jgi:hypothetical protein
MPSPFHGFFLDCTLPLHLKGTRKSHPSWFLKVPSHYTLVLLAELCLRKGKALGSETVKFLMQEEEGS